MGENTESGIHMDKHWRHSRAWFSYDLNDMNNEGRILRITYYGMDRGREFDICVNGTTVATVKLDGSTWDKFYDVDYPIPADIIGKIQNGVMNVKFVAHEGSTAGGVYYIRLLK